MARWTDEQRLELHLAIADPHDDVTILIDSTNEGIPVNGMSAADAIALNAAYSITMRPGRVCGDFDDEDGLEMALKAAQILEKRGLWPVVFASGGNGCAHLHVATFNGVSKAIMRVRRADVRELSKGKIRPPGCPHRLGGEMELVWPPDYDEALRRLRLDATDKPEPEQQLKQAPRPPRTTSADMMPSAIDMPRRRLPAWVNSALYTGWEKGERSHGLVRLANVYRDSGHTAEQYADAVMSSKGASEKYRRKSNARKILIGIFDSAHLYRTDGNHEIRLALDRLNELEQIAERAPWSNKGDLDTLRAMIEIARDAGRDEIHASARDIAIRHGSTYKTVLNRIQKLEQGGWIQTIRQSVGPFANTYRLTIPEQFRNYTLTRNPSKPSHSLMGLEGVPGYCVSLEQFHDAFRGCRSLKHVARILLAAAGEGLTVAELADRAGMKPRALKKHLGYLEHYRIAVCRSGRWSWIENAPVAELAELRGKLNKTEHDRKQYDEDRRGHRARWREHLSKMAGSMSQRLAGYVAGTSEARQFRNHYKQLRCNRWQEEFNALEERLKHPLLRVT